MSRAILRVLAQHVEEVDLVSEHGAVVEHLDRLDDLLETIGVAGDGLGVHDLALDEVDDERAFGVDLVGDGRTDADLVRLDHAVTLDVAVDEHVGADARDAHHVLLAAVLGAAVDPHDVVVVGDAAAELLVADVLALPVGDPGDDVLRRQVSLLSHSSCLSLRAALRPRGCRRCRRGATRAPSCAGAPRRPLTGEEGAGEATWEAAGHETGTSRPMPASSERTSSMAFW